MNKIKDILRKMKIKTLDGNYTIVSLPPGTQTQGKIFALINGNDETTIIAEESEWKKISGRFKDFKEEKEFRIVLLNINLGWDTVGFLSTITSALAKESISVGAFSAYSKDYLLIKEKDIKKAEKILENLTE